MISWEDTKEGIWADLYRHKGRTGWKQLFKQARKNRSFRITLWYRLSKFYHENKVPVLKQLSKWKYKRISQKFCVDMPIKASIGPGLIIYHCYGMVIHADSVIGANCMLAHQVTLAYEKGAAPTVGDQVRIAPGAKVVGGVSIGDRVVIGANAVVVKDVPSDCVSVGIPNKIINRPFVDEAERYFWNPKAKEEIKQAVVS
ncbi:MAG: serine acetyltransferase [Bacteroidota bacterium]